MQPRPYFSSRLVWRVALAVLLVLISAALLIGPQRIVNAMRELLFTHHAHHCHTGSIFLRL